MKTLSPDTSPEVGRVMIEGYRKMPAWKKLEQVWELTQLVRQLALNDIRRRYPLADDRERKLRLASRWIEPELMKKDFAWDPEEERH
jgi:hypothetical protein